MKYYALLVLPLLAVTGCTTTAPINRSATLSPAYDLTAVCLTDQGKPVSKGASYKGKTCGLDNNEPRTFPKPKLVWQ